MHRFFVEDNHIDDNIVKVTGSDFKHIYHSLRLEPGDEFIICSGDGMDHLVEIQEFKDDTVVTIIKKSYKNKNEPAIQITLAQAIPKKSNMELIVQKCTELGIHRII